MDDSKVPLLPYSIPLSSPCDVGAVSYRSLWTTYILKISSSYYALRDSVQHRVYVC